MPVMLILAALFGLWLGTGLTFLSLLTWKRFYCPHCGDFGHHVAMFDIARVTCDVASHRMASEALYPAVACTTLGASTPAEERAAAALVDTNVTVTTGTGTPLYRRRASDTWKTQ